MSTFGSFVLFLAFASCSISFACFVIAHVLNKLSKKESEAFVWAGRLGVVLVFSALGICCAVLVWGFMTGNTTLDYVVRNRSDSISSLSWLYKLAGLWAGQQGSLLFWAWLISFFNAAVVFATRKQIRPLDNDALAVSQAVLLAFICVLLFSEDNMPFAMLDPRYFTETGELNAQASVLGMNGLLEHWAMAIHPPTLFIGYAGLTIPFAYAIAALVTNDDSELWVLRCTPYLLFSWTFLGIGIGLGAVWAYVVLGWGGYWGWDPVENASLLPWLIGVALLHSFTVYRKRGAFKRWSIICACLAFSFAILSTFITRSGIVQSVHAFEGDVVSLVFFLVLIIASVAAGALGLLVRRKSFCARDASIGGETESMLSREMAYYFNNLIMVASAVLIAYLTVAPALPSFLPFGGQAISASTFNAIARPLGIIYCLLVAICPLLGWRKTDVKTFWQKAKLPGICAVALFLVLVVYFCSYLLPSYDAIIDAGGTQASGLLEQGPPFYYNALAIVGFAVASILIFNALFMLICSLRAARSDFRDALSKASGAICHMAMGVVVVGLIGSSMYVTEATTYLPYDNEADAAMEPLTIQSFELNYTGSSIEENGTSILYQTHFDVEDDGHYIGSVDPAVELDMNTQQRRLVASVLRLPTEDLFVVYRGTSDSGDLSMDVRVNPLISMVWLGFILLIAGSILSIFAKRSKAGEEVCQNE